MLSALGFVWSLPNTLIGLVLGGFTFMPARMQDGVLIFDGPPRGVTWILARMRRSAMTVGFVILSNVRVEGVLFAHERAHVRQSMLLGPLFIPTYFLLALPFGYRRHPMERAARRAAGEPE